MQRKARVFISGTPVGILEEIGEATRFTYLPEWLACSDAAPVSLTMPLRPEPYGYDGLHPFFENLLPEGWYLQVTTKTLGISKADAFGLLLATCGDCAGAVEIKPFESISSS